MNKILILIITGIAVTLGVMIQSGLFIMLSLTAGVMGLILSSPHAWKETTETFEGDKIPIQYDSIPEHIKGLVYQKQGGICGAQGCNNTHYLECHHIISRKLGGTNHPANLIYLCPNCHAAADKGYLRQKTIYNY